MSQIVSEPQAVVVEGVGRRSLKEIIEAAGGPGAIAAASDGGVTAEAVYKWRKIGIPDRHWPLLMRMCAVSADELLAANVAARTPTESGRE